MDSPRTRKPLHTARVPLLVVAIAGGAGLVSADETARRAFVMGTWLDVAVTAPDRSTAVAAAEAAMRAVEEADRRLSSWRRGSELSGLNHAPPGSWVSLSSELADDLAEAFGWARRTDGWFNPVVASLVRAWDLRGAGRVPTDGELVEALAAARLTGFEFRRSAARRLDPMAGIEEGGFGKGVALRDAAAAAVKSGADCVRFDFGGQTHAAGACASVRIGIADPRNRAAIVAHLRVSTGSVATSGNAERGVDVDGVRFGHLLDPHAGRPAPDFGSVTVWTADPVAADCLATALYAMGPQRGVRWLESHDGIEAVYLIAGDSGVELLARDTMLRKISIERPEVTVRNLASVGRSEAAAASDRRHRCGSTWR